MLRSTNGTAGQSFDRTDEFIVALRKAMTEFTDIEELFAIWEQNVDAVRAISKHLRRSTPKSLIAQNLVAYLKSRAVALARQGGKSTPAMQIQNASDRSTLAPTGHAKIDKSVLTISEPKRFRSKEHLRFVAQQPCLICGRKPSHAHHFRSAAARPGP